jgi:hypothetical protein
MKRWLATIVLVAFCAVPLSADVRVTTTTTIEGGLAAMMGGMAPRVVMHIKGMKARADVDMGTQTMSTITDITTKQFILLNAAQKTAHVMTPDALPKDVPLSLPKLDATIKPTGRSQTIAGAACEEFTVAMTISMAEMAASPKLPPEAAQMLKSLKISMNGSAWVAKSGPGVAEYMAYQSASTSGAMAALMGAIPGMKGSGIDRFMGAFSEAGGIPFLTELLMTVEGNDQIAEVMKAQGPIKVITKITEVSTDPISEDLFKIPDGFTITK